MACGACGAGAPAGKKYRLTLPDGSTRDYVSRLQALQAANRAGGGTLTVVPADDPPPSGGGTE